MTGVGNLSDQVFLIDFGLAQLFRDPSTRRHVPLMSGLKTVGTVAFTSINSHSGQTQSRRDDLESLVYSIVYLCRGRLPWQDVVIRGVGLRNMRRPFSRRRLPRPTRFAKAYLHPSSPSHNISNCSTLMRSHGTSTFALSSCDARLSTTTRLTSLHRHLHSAKLVSLPPFPKVNECESILCTFYLS